MSEQTKELLAAVEAERAARSGSSDMLSRIEQEKQRRSSVSQPAPMQTTSGNFWNDFARGARQPVEFLAQAMSGSAPMRGIEVAPAPPDTLGSRMGSTAVEAAMAALPLGALASRVQPAAQGAGAIRSTLQNIVSDVGRGFSQNRSRFLAAETGMGATSGAGGFIAETLYPESDVAGFVGEILGGAAPQVAAAATRGTLNLAGRAARASPVTGAVLRTWDEIAKAKNPVTAGARAQDRFQRAIGDLTPQDIIARMDEEVLPEARILMTPAQLSGVPGLLSLEKSIINSTDELRQKSVEQLESLNNIIVNSLRGGSSDAARTGVERVRGDYLSLLNESVRIAALRTEEALQRLVPGAPAEHANRIARRELESALQAAVTQEKQLFGLLDRATPVNTENTRQRFREMQIEAGVAGAPNIPNEAARLFGKEGALGEATTLGEMRTAQSVFREGARAARVGANPNYNVARMYDSLASAITEDISNITGEQADIVAAAVDFSRLKNQVFGQGQVGKILRGASDSGDVTPDALTLKNTLGMGGAAGAQAYDEIINAVGFAATQADYRGYENIASTMEDYVKNEFMRSVVRNGEVNLGRAETFINNNQEILRRLPALSSEIAEAATARTAQEAQQILMRQGARMFDDPLTSKASLLINKGATEAFTGVFTGVNPSREMRTLVDIVNGDQTGEALQGLKAGFFEFILDKSMNNKGIVSGETLLSFLNNDKNKSALGQLLSQAEIDNLGVIARTAQRANAAQGAVESLEGITSDQLSRSADVGLRLLGGVVGREVSTLLGGQSLVIPAVASAQFKKLGAAGLINPARRLIVDAMQNPALFRQVVLNSFVLKRPLNREGTRLLNAWASNALLSQGLSYVEGDQEEVTQ